MSARAIHLAELLFHFIFASAEHRDIGVCASRSVFKPCTARFASAAIWARTIATMFVYATSCGEFGPNRDMISVALADVEVSKVSQPTHGRGVDND